MGAFQPTGYTSEDIERIKEEVRGQMRAAPCPECERLKAENMALVFERQSLQGQVNVRENLMHEARKERDAARAERDRWKATVKSAEGEADRQRERANLAESALATAQARDEEVRRLREIVERYYDDHDNKAGEDGCGCPICIDAALGS